MKIGVTRPAHRWLTAADAADSVPAELSDLGAHVEHCNGCRGRWFALRCTIEAVDVFVSAHFVTTLLIASAAMGLAMVIAL